MRLCCEGELKWEVSPRRSHWAPLFRVKPRTKYLWVHVLTPLGFAAKLLVEDALALVVTPEWLQPLLQLEELICKICKACSRDKESLY